MRAYLRVLIGVFVCFLGFTTFVSVAVDPYDILGGPKIAHFNRDKTRIDEDGRRVTVGQEILTGGHRTLLFGSSRAVEGFPRALDDADWPGGLYNAGIRGGTAFEMARALAVAGRSPDLRCVVVGLDSLGFQTIIKSRATYWISALPDGNAALAAARISLSPHAFYRSLQTLRDNVFGRPPRVRYPDVYKPGEQRARMLDGAQSFLINSQYFFYDPDRLQFMLQALDGLAARGVQVMGVILPRHPWHDEAIYQSAHRADDEAWRGDLARAFQDMSAHRPSAPCVGTEGAALWDFSRFQVTPLPSVPSEQATQPQPHFYETTHFMPDIGTAVLDRIRGKTPQPPFDQPDFGARLTPQNLAEQDEKARERRARWQASDPDVPFILQAYADMLAKVPPANTKDLPRISLSRDDLQTMVRDVQAMRTKVRSLD